MCLLIPCPKSPGKDFDTFMRPLIDELKNLWVGVATYDATSGGMFNFKAVVLWTTSDFPAYAYLSGYSTKGHLACPECLANTHFRSIRSKTCYMGSRKWLPSNHQWRKSKDFDSFVEYAEPTKPKSGDEIVHLLDQLPSVTPGKAPNTSGTKRKLHELHPLHNWSPHSIFFELEYWSKLKLQHNMDVMHVEKNIFPPSFFTIMVHLCIHLPDQALLGGPIACRWMYSAERCLGTYKGYVRNAALLEGSIAEAYVVDEELTFLSLYVKGLETKFTRPERNIDVICNESSSFALFKARLRCSGTSHLKFLTTEFDALQWYILNNCHEDIKSYLDEHMDILKQNFSNNLEQLQARTFPTWFKSKMEELRHKGSSEATDDMYSLVLGPFDRYTSCTSCIINGVRFHSKCRDDTLHTQNCGISVPSNHGGEEVDFYGVLLEVMELSYILDRKVVVFRCKWYNTDKRMRNIHCETDLTTIKMSSEWYANDPYILATQAKQVFYLADTKRDKQWMFVQKISHRNIRDIPIVDAIDEVLATPYCESSTSSSSLITPKLYMFWSYLIA
ncbi:hypothetical protein OSB04_028982 [Centaurea solstitialis]|uniref:DUF4216 domain-containing protein n=1 Tax=Centaurea solstitialis TaxID=347529 RepID=A0AA38SV70_9ASTR|nr:hypothetical protein OSB04_028982 [Centaurea solstitialis]